MDDGTGDRIDDGLDDGIHIRPARPDDWEAIRLLWTDAGLSVRPAGRDRPGDFPRQLAAFATTYLVAEIRGRLVGVVFGTHDQRKGWINRLAVHPTVRRRGVARRLIDACERGFVDLGIEIFASLVEQENTVSAALFDAAGYKRDIPVHYFHKRLRPEV